MLICLHTEPCQSGLTYLFAKEAGCKSPRWFESSRLRKKVPQTKSPGHQNQIQNQTTLIFLLQNAIHENFDIDCQTLLFYKERFG